MKRLIAVGLIVNAGLFAGILGILMKKEVVIHAAGNGVPVGNGDVNGDGTIDLSDGVALLNWLFLGGKAPVAIECPAPGQVPVDGPSGNGDVNGDRAIDISDAVYLLSSLFTGGPAPKTLECRPPVSGTPLPDTGQTKCYDIVEGQGWTEVPCDQASCPGQDGAYSTGCPMDGRFVDNGDATVTDNCTGLMWQKETADVNAVSWCEALAYCEDLSFAGHDDWRLPNVRELQSIVDYGRYDPAIDPVFGGVSDVYWSSNSDAIHPGYAWMIVYFLDGSVYGANLKGPGQLVIRAVRGGSILPVTGQTKCYGQFGAEIPCDGADCPGQDGFYKAGCPSEGRFVDNGDSTVTDNCTGLMWQKDTADVNGDGQLDGQDIIHWCDALAYCENLSFAGHDDWRLPNVRELQSIVDFGRFDSAIDPLFGASGLCWSSTSETSHPNSAWHVSFFDGSVSFSSIGKESSAGGGVFLDVFVRTVRNAQ